MPEDGAAPQARRSSPRRSTPTVDALAETIIPADDHSPGAHAARVADYIDLLLSESAPRRRTPGRSGLAALDEASPEPLQGAVRQSRPPRSRSSSSPRSRKNEARPADAGSRSSSVAAKDATIRGYYTSEIGIHKELPLQGQPVPAASSSAAPHPERRVRASSKWRSTDADQSPRASTHASSTPMTVRPTVQAAQQAASRQQAAAIKPGTRPRTSSSSARAPPAAWPPSSSRPPASRCCCSRPAACSICPRNTGRWSGRTQRRRRGRLPADEHALERRRVQHARPALRRRRRRWPPYKKVMSYSGNTFTRNWLVNEKQNPTTGTPYAWVRARVLGGKTNLWGRVSLRFSELGSQGQVARRLRRGLADRLRRHLAVLRQGRSRCSASSGTKENLPQLPDGIYQRAREAELRRGDAQERPIAKMGRHLIPGRAGVTTEGVANKYRAALHGPRPLRPRLRSAGADALADRADLPGARHRQPRPCARTRRSPKCSSTRTRARRPASASSTA